MKRGARGGGLGAKRETKVRGSATCEKVYTTALRKDFKANSTKGTAVAIGHNKVPAGEPPFLGGVALSSNPENRVFPKRRLSFKLYIFAEKKGYFAAAEGGRWQKSS